MSYDGYDDTPVATPADAVREYVRNVGRETPDEPWILSQYDSWHKNPFYAHPLDQPYPPHPEDDGE